METVVRPWEELEWRPTILDWSWRDNQGRPWIASLLLHIALVGVVAVLPSAAPAPAPQLNAGLRRTTTLVAPPLTQTAPNRGRIGREFTLDSLQPRRRLQAPPPLPSVSRRPVPAPAVVPEPPRFETAQPQLSQAPPLGSTYAPAAPPPQIQPEEKPKLAFERPGVPGGSPRPGGLSGFEMRPPSSSVAEAARSAARSSGGLVVGDFDLPGSGGLRGALGLPAPQPSQRSRLELLSDPMGVDFKPYLIQILAAVKRNWLAVIPESARLGRQGRVQIQFAIARNGQVPKLVIALPSGTDALDRAAVAGISASNPFPPLPAEYRAEQIRLQFTFLYNMN
jgi:TonB family protein